MKDPQIGRIEYSPDYKAPEPESSKAQLLRANRSDAE
jgi:hypothetical protein